MSEKVSNVNVRVIYDALIWIDHFEAHVIYVSADISDPCGAKPDHWSRHLRATVDSRGSAIKSHSFYCQVTKACEDTNAILLAGLSSAKTEFVKHLHRHSPETLDRISGIETLPRLTDGHLVAEARRLFARNASQKF